MAGPPPGDPDLSPAPSCPEVEPLPSSLSVSSLPSAAERGNRPGPPRESLRGRLIGATDPDGSRGGLSVFSSSGHCLRPLARPVSVAGGYPPLRALSCHRPDKRGFLPLRGAGHLRTPHRRERSPRSRGRDHCRAGRARPLPRPPPRAGLPGQAPRRARTSMPGMPPPARSSPSGGVGRIPSRARAAVRRRSPASALLEVGRSRRGRRAIRSRRARLSPRTGSSFCAWGARLQRIGTLPPRPSTRRKSSLQGTGPTSWRLRASVSRTVPSVVEYVVSSTFECSTYGARRSRAARA